MKRHLHRLALWMLVASAVPVSLWANQQADDLHAKFLEARKNSQYDLAAKYECDAAKLDPDKYGKTCDSVSSYVNARLRAFQTSMDLGRAEFNSKDWTKAMRDFSSITFGPNYAEAQSLYAQAKRNAEQPVSDPSADALKAARMAFASGDFTGAEANLRAVKSPDLQAQAQSIQSSIQSYNANMQQAAALQAGKKYSEALQKYNAALAISSNGPGNPAGKIQAVTALLSRTPAVPATPVDNTQKIKGYLAEAAESKAKENWQGVIVASDRILALDPRNADAQSLKAEAQDSMKAQLAKDPKALEDTLLSGIRNYYESDFAQAGTAINLYINAGGSRSIGAAHFYLGATLLSQAFFSDPKNKDDHARLRQSAVKEFDQAKQQKFRPVEKAVSPKILAVWNQSGL